MAAPLSPRKPHTEERKRKISEAIKKKHQDAEYRKKFLDNLHVKKGELPGCLRDYWENNSPKGENNPNWKGGRTRKAELVRSSKWYREQTKSVLERDDFSCQDCGKRGGELHVHHIIPFVEIIDDEDKLRDKSNLTTLCVPCHRSTDSYGKQLSHSAR